MDRMYRDAGTPENTQPSSTTFSDPDDPYHSDDPFDDVLNDPYATYSAAADDRAALEAIARDGDGSASRLPATVDEARSPAISASRWLPADEAEDAWRTGTMKAITHKRRAVRPHTRPLAPPRRFRRMSRFQSGVLLIVTIALAIAATVGAVDLGRQAYHSYQQLRPHATTTPAHPHTTPTITITVTPHH